MLSRSEATAPRLVAAALLSLFGCLLWCGGDARRANTRGVTGSGGGGPAGHAGTWDAVKPAAGSAYGGQGERAVDAGTQPAGASPEGGAGAPPACVPQPDTPWVPGDSDTIAIEPTAVAPNTSDTVDAGCYRDPYLPDQFEPPCVQPRPRPNCKDGWCRIEPGCFVMGAPWCEWGRAMNSENPVQVTLTHAFRMQQTELTQADWMAQDLPNPSGLMPDGTGDCHARDCPVGNVTWPEALAFANLLSRDAGLAECYALGECDGALGEGLACSTVQSTRPSVYDCPGFRLPTGAEWEYAARAGTRTSVYSGEVIARDEKYVCVDDPVLSPIAWYCANSGASTHPVCGKLPNDWGLYDLVGNAGEWTGSPVVSGYGTGPFVDWGSGLSVAGLRNSAPPAVQLRGNFFNSWPNVLRAADVLSSSPNSRSPGAGFRLAQTLFPEDP